MVDRFSQLDFGIGLSSSYFLYSKKDFQQLHVFTHGEIFLQLRLHSEPEKTLRVIMLASDYKQALQVTSLVYPFRQVQTSALGRVTYHENIFSVF